LPNSDNSGGFVEAELHFAVDTKDIVYINAVLDSYEGLGIMRTLDRTSGHIVIYTAMENKLRELLESLSRDDGISAHPIQSK
jgi:hypothetical protein